MKMTSTLMLGLMAAALSATAAAAPVPNGGGVGYHGQVFYTNGFGAGVTSQPTWNECDQKLRWKIDYDTRYNGRTVVKIIPCHYTGGPHSGEDEYDHRQDYDLSISAPTPEASATLSAELLGQIRQLRETYRMDAYEQALGVIRDAAAK